MNIFVILFVISIILTISRNAWLGMIISIPIIFKKKGVLFLVALFILLILFYYFHKIDLFTINFIELNDKLLPSNILK